MDLPSPNRLHINASPTRKGNRFINKTLQILSEYPYPTNMHFRHAALIIGKGGKILSYGFSSFKPHPMPRIPILLGKSNRDLDNILTIHAEMDAIKRVANPENLKGATIFVARVSHKHGERLSCPCESCEYYIRKYGIERVIYSTDVPGVWFETKIKKI